MGNFGNSCEFWRLSLEKPTEIHHNSGVSAVCAIYDGFLWVFPRKVVRIRMKSRNSLYNAPAKKVSKNGNCPPKDSPGSLSILSPFLAHFFLPCLCLSSWGRFSFGVPCLPHFLLWGRFLSTQARHDPNSKDFHEASPKSAGNAIIGRDSSVVI